MTLLWTILIGFFVGLVARWIMPGRDPMGMIFTVLLGIIGALIAQLLGQALGLYGQGEPAGFIASVTGAVLILFIGRRLQRTSP